MMSNDDNDSNSKDSTMADNDDDSSSDEGTYSTLYNELLHEAHAIQNRGARRDATINIDTALSIFFGASKRSRDAPVGPPCRAQYSPLQRENQSSSLSILHLKRHRTSLLPHIMDDWMTTGTTATTATVTARHHAPPRRQ
jgi:hypothetical protein